MRPCSIVVFGYHHSLSGAADSAANFVAVAGHLSSLESFDPDIVCNKLCLGFLLACGGRAVIPSQRRVHQKLT